ncbi:MAG: arabinose isomerase, partial [Proteobacteria bacterium]|nr:arabinose isomerase [Pseudomonadota bacterium]
KVGLFGIGLDTYWPQFKGLLPRLLGYQEKISHRFEREGVEVCDFGMVDSTQKARDAADYFQTEGIDILFLYISTYALSSTVLPVIQNAKVPIVVLNLQPDNAIDYESFNKIGDRGTMTGEWLAHCQACSLPEISNVFIRSGIDFSIVTGTLDDKEAWQEIDDWIEASKVASLMRNNRVGILGHYYSGMLDVYTDLTLQSSTFGSHFEQIEMCELFEKREGVTKAQLDLKLEQFQREFDVTTECEEDEIIRAAKTSVALDLLIKEHQIGSLAYYYEGTGGNSYENIVTSIIPGNTLLTASNVPVAGECEIKNVQAM